MKRYHKKIYENIENETNEFLEFAKEKGAFDWQSGDFSVALDADYRSGSRQE